MNQDQSQTDAYSLTDDDTATILKMLQTDISANKKGLWTQESSNTIREKCSSAKHLETFRDIDLKVIVRFLKNKVQIKILESYTKRSKIEKLCQIFGFKEGEKTQPTKGSLRKRQNVKTLSELATKVLTF